MPWGPTTSRGLPPEFLRSCLLLLLGERDAHGYQLCEQLTDLGIDMDSGTIYRQLRSMEDEGLVVSHWELSSSGPPKRTYVLTSEGFHQLERCASSIRRIVTLLFEYVDRSDDVFGQARDGGPVIVLGDEVHS